MMKQLTILIFLLSMNPIIGQVWCEQGAKWTYNFSTINSGGTEIWQYTHDSIIQNRAVQIINVTTHLFQYNQFGQLQGNVYSGPTHITATSGDSVFYFNSDKNKFYLLYNFGAAIGDEWVVHEGILSSECDSFSTVKVIATGDTLINGVLLKTITLEQANNGQFSLDGIVIESIGIVNPNKNHFGFLPGGRNCPNQQIVFEWNDYSLRCFQDSTIGTYQIDTIDCNYFTVGILVNDVSDFSISPNPSNSILTINLKSVSGHTSTAQITSLQGEKIMNFDLNSIQNELDISTLNGGVYLLCIGNSIKRFVKI